jgi:hypothetical protein
MRQGHVSRNSRAFKVTPRRQLVQKAWRSGLPRTLRVDRSTESFPPCDAAPAPSRTLARTIRHPSCRAEWGLNGAIRWHRSTRQRFLCSKRLTRRVPDAELRTWLAELVVTQSSLRRPIRAGSTAFLPASTSTTSGKSGPPRLPAPTASAPSASWRIANFIRLAPSGPQRLCLDQWNVQNLRRRLSALSTDPLHDFRLGHGRDSCAGRRVAPSAAEVDVRMCSSPCNGSFRRGGCRSVAVLACRFGAAGTRVLQPGAR